MKVLAITFGSIVNVVSMSWSHFGSLVISGEFLVSSSPITTKLEIVVLNRCFGFVVWPQHWLPGHHTWSYHADSLIHTALTMNPDERGRVIVDQWEQNLSTNWLKMKHYRGRCL